MAELEPERGLQSLPTLLAERADCDRALALLLEVVVAVELTAEQRSMLDRTRDLLGTATVAGQAVWPLESRRRRAKPRQPKKGAGV